MNEKPVIRKAHNKKEDVQRFRTSSKEELVAMLKKHQARIQELRFQLAFGKQKNTAELRILRRKIAQILTAFREKILAS